MTQDAVLNYPRDMVTSHDIERVSLRMPAGLHRRIKNIVGERGVNAYLTALAEKDIRNRELAAAFDALEGVNVLMPSGTGDLPA